MPDLQIKHPIPVVWMNSVFQEIAMLLYRSYMRLIIAKKYQQNYPMQNRISPYRHLP